jgi:EAL domain-containing protein (putative c-di-GMP-specific phosphodiesterase class I)/PAS domain-containing protein
LIDTRKLLAERLLRAFAPYIAALLVLTLCAALLFAVYFTRLELPWVSFLAGVLVAAVLALVARNSRSEWRLARRAAQLARARERLAAETARRERAENALLATRGKIELVDQHLPVALLYVDRELRVQYHNRALVELLGLKAEDLDAGAARAMLGAEDFAELEPPLRAALSGGASSRLWRPRAGAALGRVLRVHFRPNASGGAVAGCFLTLAEAPPEAKTTPESEAQAAGPTPASAQGDGDVLGPDDSLTGWAGPAEFLLAAIERNDFRLYAQRIVALGDDGRERHELLIRMAEEEQNLLPPGAFLPIAERHGLMPRLDRWVVEHLLAWVDGQFPDSRLRDGLYFVNLSAATVQDRYFPGFVREALHRYSLPGNLLCFEIDAHRVSEHVAATAAMAAPLRAAGCAVALAGFGAERAAFDLLRGAPANHLTRVGLDYLKIDGNLVLNILRDKVAHARVTAINKVAHAKGLRTIAEYVESDEILAALRAIGVDFAQGFGIATPQPLRQLG